MLGREVATIMNERLNAGSYELPFTAEGLSSGVYLYKLTAGGFSEVRKLQLLR